MVRLKNVGSLGVVAALMGLAAWPVSRMLVDAWNVPGGVVQSTVSGALAGVGLAAVVAFATGLVAAFTLLFVVDSTKLSQSALFLLLVWPIFYTTLFRANRWVIDWVANVPFLLAGGGVGLGVGLVGARVNAGTGGPIPTVREFPAAARGLYWLVAVVSVGGFVQVHVLAGQPSFLLRDLLGTIVIVVLTAVFTTYRDDRTIVIVSPDDVSEANVFGGIYQQAVEEYGAESLGDRGPFSRIRSLTVGSPHERPEVAAPAEGERVDPRPDSKTNVKRFPDDSGFRFRPPTPFARTLEVRARGYRPYDFAGLATAESVASGPSRGDRVIGALGHYVAMLLPGTLRELLRSDRRNTAVGSVASADAMLLVVPFGDIWDAEATEIDDGSLLGRYYDIYEAGRRRGTPVYWVVTDSHEAETELYDQWQESLDGIRPGRLGRFIQTRGVEDRVGGEAPPVLPVFRAKADGPRNQDTTYLWGANELLNKLV